MQKRKSNQKSYNIVNENIDINGTKDLPDNISGREIKDLVDYLVLQKVKLNIQSDELQKLREKLQNTKDQFSTLYNFNPISYITLDEKRKIIDANLSTSSLLDQKQDLLIGKPFEDYIPERFRNVFYEQLNEITEDNLAKKFELKLKNGLNKEFFASLLITSEHDQNTKEKRYRVAIRNIDRRKNLENKLEEYSTIFKKVLKSEENNIEELSNQKSSLQINNNDQVKEEIKVEPQDEDEDIKMDKNFQLRSSFDNIICKSDEFNEVLKKVEQVAATDMTVLIQGETGTGKELIAKELHSLSKRRDRPLIKLDCTTLPSNLIESELFGHEKGAFTGAYNKKLGRFELANKGTIFLDEIGELPLETQSKLLRILQEGEFERLGSSETYTVDVRVIAATNRDLEKEIEKGDFREDLYYRLNVYPINLPPLRERKNDISILTKYFIEMYNKKLDRNVKEIPGKTMKMLKDYSWPGNVRELKNIIERGVLISKGSKLMLFDSLTNKYPQHNTDKDNLTDTDSVMEKGKTLEEMEKDYILKVLRSTDWQIGGDGGAAEILGIKRTTLYEKMKRLGITKKKS